MKIKEFLKENKITLLSILILGIIAYGIKLVTYSFSIDTEAFLIERDELLKSWLGIGRYGLVFIKKIVDCANISLYLANFVGFILLILSTVVCIYNVNMITNKKDKVANIILGGLIITSPIIVEQFNFTLQCVEVSLAMLLLNLAFTIINRYIMKKDKKILLIIPVIFSTIAFSCYQTMLPLFITFSAFFTMLFIHYKGEKGVKIILTYIIIFLISIFAYKAIDEVVIRVSGVERTSYLSEQVVWLQGGKSIIEGIAKAGFSIANIVLMQGIFYNAGLLICIFEFVYLIIKKFDKKKWIYYVAIITFLISPFILQLITGGITAVRTQIQVHIVTGLAVYFLYLMLDNELEKKLHIIVFGIIICTQLFTCIKLFYSDYEKNALEKEMATEIMDDLKEKELYGKKNLIFVGNYSFDGIPVILKGEVMGKSFFEWDKETDISSNKRIRNFLSVLEYENYEIPSKEQYEEALEQSKDMASYPEEGYISEKDNYIIIKLGEKDEKN